MLPPAKIPLMMGETRVMTEVTVVNRLLPIQFVQKGKLSAVMVVLMKVLTAVMTKRVSIALRVRLVVTAMPVVVFPRETSVVGLAPWVRIYQALVPQAMTASLNGHQMPDTASGFQDRLRNAFH